MPPTYSEIRNGIPLQCSICGETNGSCRHLNHTSSADTSNTVTPYQQLAIATDGSIWSWGATAPISLTSSPQRRNSRLYDLFRTEYGQLDYSSSWLVAKQNYIDLLKSHGVKRYKIIEDIGSIKIKIFHYLINIDKINKHIQNHRPMGVQVDLSKQTFFEWIRMIWMIRYLRYRYLKYKRNNRVRLTKFDLMVGKI